MKGIYEQDSKIWQRTYKFDDWKQVFLDMEDESDLCRSLNICKEENPNTYNLVDPRKENG
jgi:hypothetical protein